MTTSTVLVITDQKYYLSWQSNVIQTLSADKNINLVILQLKGPSYNHVKQNQFPYRFYRRVFKMQREVRFSGEELVADFQAEYRVSTNGRLDLAESDVKKIKAFNANIIIRFGLGILGGSFFDLGSKIVSVHQSLVNFHRGSGAGFWEYAWGLPISGVSLLELNEKLDAGRVVSEARFKLPASPRTWQRYVNNYSAELMISYIKGRQLLSPVTRVNASNIRAKKITKNPRSKDIIKFLLTFITFKVFERIFRKKRNKKYLVLLNGKKFISPPAQVEYYADPAFIDVGSMILVEAMEKGGVGEIYEVTSEKDYKKLDLKIYEHKSFPRVFRYREDLFLSCEHTAASEDNQCIWKLSESLQPEKIELPTLPKLIDPIFLVDEHGACHVLGGEVGNLCSISNIQWFTSETGITGPFKKSHNISLDIAVGVLWILCTWRVYLYPATRLDLPLWI